MPIRYHKYNHDIILLLLYKFQIFILFLCCCNIFQVSLFQLSCNASEFRCVESAHMCKGHRWLSDFITTFDVSSLCTSLHYHHQCAELVLRSPLFLIHRHSQFVVYRCSSCVKIMQYIKLQKCVICQE